MGGLLYAQGKLEEAEPYFREALAAQRRKLGDEHSDTQISINNLGRLLKELGKLEEAEILALQGDKPADQTRESDDG